MNERLPLLLTALLVVTGAALQASTDTSPSASRHRIGAIIYVPEEIDWGQEVERGMRTAAEAEGVELIVRRHSFSLRREMDLIRELVADEVDAIVLATTEEVSSVYEIQEAHQAGVLIVCFNTCIERNDAARYVAAFYQSDQAEMGYRTGTYLAQWVAERSIEPRIAIVQCELFEACYQRGQGFRAALADAGVEWTLVASREALSEEASRDVVIEVLTEKPDVNIIWGDNGENTIGAVQGVRAAGRQGEVFVFGTEIGVTSAEMLRSTEDEVLQSLSSMMTYEMARQAVEAAARILDGEDLGHYLHILGSPFVTRQDRAEIENFLDRRRSPESARESGG